MAWQPIDTTRAVPRQWARRTIKGQVSKHGGLTLYLGRLAVEGLGWADGQRVAVMLGAGESEGKIALKPDAAGKVALAVNKQRLGAGSAVLRIGHFAALTRVEERVSAVLNFGLAGEMLVITLPDDWLKRRAPVQVAGRTIGVPRFGA